MRIEKLNNVFLNNSFYQRDRWQQLKEHRQRLEKSDPEAKQATVPLECNKSYEQSTFCEVA